MLDSVGFLPPILFVQALGVALAWGADALSWKWRGKREVVFYLNLVSLVVLFPLCAPLGRHPWSAETIIKWLAAAACWLVILALVQRKQVEISLRAAFFGAQMQLWCFVWSLYGGFGILISFPISAFRVFPASSLLPYWLFLVWLVSATLTYALLSLFRPTISAMANALRQSLKKDRPLR